MKKKYMYGDDFDLKGVVLLGIIYNNSYLKVLGIVVLG